MTITEFINKVEDFYCFSADEVKLQFADRLVKGIAVYVLDQNSKDILVFILPIDATSIFDIIWRSNFENNFNGNLSFDHSKLPDGIKVAKTYENTLNMLISKFIATPIDQRDPEPKYYLKLGNNPVNGKAVYLMKNDGVKFNLSYKTDSSDESRLQWSEQDIADLRDVYPKMASTIALIKKPVGDD